jgi:hypothetical protein
MADLDKTLNNIFKKAPKPEQETMNFQAESGVIGHVMVASVERLNLPEKENVISLDAKRTKPTTSEIFGGRIYRRRDV